ncbi:MAG: lecithin--cholesterol acyltransferase, partial [Phycisphaerae bacterium]|nr:lecithin--cholesterol acyltransferase [Phycisphaerae bacterium]NIP51522.1 lecithin--cholesterol acyltransferase [Phycisphaerae bacterium]NIW43536.1 lecithin--cholesterol acyltransferase [Gammaproteobacteria bacterium]NIX27470.1 lecithin--cholesterol acyltransferase [Phycisphaerae bacterium]
LGSVNIKAPANYFEFAYDWRQDIRLNARKLKALIDERLPLWQKHTGNDDARVILIGHSMGGLVSRHYLEMLGGWRQCKALITLGTPHRGAVNAAETISNGLERIGIDISDTLRSFPSMYQILPIYPVIDIGSEVVRLMDTDDVPNLSREKAVEGTKFLLDIADAVENHRGMQQYRNSGYQMIPVVGTRQPTNQSLRISNGRLKPIRTSAIMDASLTHGDGTVP